MTINRLTVEDIQAAALEIGIHFTESEAVTYHGLMQGQLDAYDLVDAMVEPLPEVTFPRPEGVQPAAADNPFNAWAVKATIAGAPEGKLATKRVAIKDNVCVAGLRMMNGASILDGYVPEIDATIVQRILEAGGDILGKSVCE